jgi:hypothetical protein
MRGLPRGLPLVSNEVDNWINKKPRKCLTSKVYLYAR